MVGAFTWAFAVVLTGEVTLLVFELFVGTCFVFGRSLEAQLNGCGAAILELFLLKLSLLELSLLELSLLELLPLSLLTLSLLAPHTEFPLDWFFCVSEAVVGCDSGASPGGGKFCLPSEDNKLDESTDVLLAVFVLALLLLLVIVFEVCLIFA